MRFQVLLALALAAFVVAQDDELLLDDEVPSIDEPVDAEEGPITEEGPISSPPVIVTPTPGAGKLAGAICKVKRSYGRKAASTRGNCVADHTCDLRYGKRQGQGRCRPNKVGLKKTCGVRFQDCKKRGTFCHTVAPTPTADDIKKVFWGTCEPKYNGGAACQRDFQCKTGACEDHPDIDTVSFCKKAPTRRY